MVAPRGRNGEIEHAALAFERHHIGGGALQHAQGGLYLRKIGIASGRELQTIAAALEQGKAQALLQRNHLAAHAALCEVHFLPCERERA
jgi:uncharacterized protein YcfJ